LIFIFVGIEVFSFNLRSLTRRESGMQDHRSQEITIEAGRFRISKRSGFLNGNLGDKRLSTWKKY